MQPYPAENPQLFPEPPLATAKLVPAPACAADSDPDVGPGALPESDSLPPQTRGLAPLAAWFDYWLVEGRAYSWLASAAVHAAAVLLLSLLAFTQPPDVSLGWLEGILEQEDLAALELDIDDLGAVGVAISMPAEAAQPFAVAGPAGGPLVTPSDLPLHVESGHSSLPDPALEIIGDPLAQRGGGMSGRHPQNRRGLALSGGGTQQSESAVELGLVWLASHQFPDGCWRFDLEACPQCGGACRNSGFMQSTTASTGLALLCFMGAGYTQHEGPYRETVAKGLYYLADRMLLTTFGGDLRDLSVISEKDDGILLIKKSGDMYSHAIATLALCEAYAMTGDENLAGPAQEAVHFIVHAQHEKGGWRYAPGEPGDTSVTGWQLTALKSASLANLEIPRAVWYRAAGFLDSVEDDRGATYRYQEPSKPGRSMSAVGLFSRMMLGWTRDHIPLKKGMARIADQAPHQNDMYFNYYASQALHHWGGSGWRRWNPLMRDYLVRSQARDGHEMGSWYFQEAWSNRGGRLYTTTLSILTLEVYYRYMPMYQEAFVGAAP